MFSRGANLLLLAAVFAAVPLAPALRAEDVVHLKPRGAVRGDIISLDDRSVRVRVKLAAGGGSSTQNISMANVRLIDFGPVPGEEALLAQGKNASANALTDLWAQERPYLAQRNSNAGEIGLLLGEILLAADDPQSHANARNLFTIVEEGDWDEARRLRAKGGRLEALVKTGAAAEVVEEAREIAAAGGDSGLLLKAEYFLARADLDRLRALIADNPLWREDDFVRPEIEVLYHDLLDRFLAPLLFHGTETGPATDGLLAAGETYYLIDRPEQARARFADVGILYPDSPAKIEAEAFLKKLSNENDNDETTTDPEK